MWGGGRVLDIALCDPVQSCSRATAQHRGSQSETKDPCLRNGVRYDKMQVHPRATQNGLPLTPAEALGYDSCINLSKRRAIGDGGVCLGKARKGKTPFLLKFDCCARESQGEGVSVVLPVLNQKLIFLLFLLS